MKEKLNFRMILNLKGGDMFKKVLVFSVICAFMISNVCFAVPVNSLVPDSAVKSSVDNIAIGSKLSTGSFEAADIKNIAQMFQALSANDAVGKMWVGILEKTALPQEGDTAAQITEKLQNLKVTKLSDDVLRVAFGDKTGYISVKDGQVTISETDPSEIKDFVAKGTKAEKNRLSAKAIESSKIVDAAKKDEEGKKLNETLDNADGNAEVAINNAWKGKNTIKLNEVTDLMKQDFISKMMKNMDFQAESEDAFVGGMSSLDSFFVPNGMQNYTDIIMHELLEGLGFEHEDILNIQAAIWGIAAADRKNDTNPMGQTLADIKTLKTAAIAETKNVQENKTEVLKAADKQNEALTQEITDIKEPVNNVDELVIAIMDKLFPGIDNREQKLNLGYGLIREKLLNDSSSEGLLGVVADITGEKDLAQAITAMEIVAALQDENGKIPVISAKMLVEEKDGEFGPTTFGTPIISALKRAKLKEGAVIHAISTKGNVQGQQDFINKIVGIKDANGKVYNLFQFTKENESNIGLNAAQLSRAVVVYNEDGEVKGDLETVQYYKVQGDYNKINGFKFFTTIMQKGILSAADQKVLADIAAGEFTNEALEFTLTEEMRFQVEVVKALIQKA